jgi:hypothetical protein
MLTVLDDLLREQRRQLRLVPWLAWSAAVLTVAGAWLVGILPMAGRVGVSIAALAVGGGATVAVRRRLDAATVIGEHASVRVQELRQRSATDPAARAEYAEYLAEASEILRTLPRPRGMSRAQHADLIAKATHRMAAERDALLLSSAAPPANSA